MRRRDRHQTLGRVGAAGQSKTEHTGRGGFDRAVAGKLARGYTRVAVDTRPAAAAPAPKAVAAAARRILAPAGDAVLTDLVGRLAACNRHTISALSGGMIRATDDGHADTPLGPVTHLAVQQARRVLRDMIAAPDDRSRGRLTERYLRLVPQRVPVSAGRGWADRWLYDQTAPARQGALLDALDTALHDDAAPGMPAGGDPASFRYRVAALPATHPDHRAVVSLYRRTVQTAHAWSTLTPARVFTLTDTRPVAVDDTIGRVGGVRRLWHGTPAGNILSILAAGLVVPPAHRPGTIRVTGRMFGDGVYLSESASKSAGYSVGYWERRRPAGGAFLLLTDTATGHPYRPDAGADPARVAARAHSGRYDSIDVQPGHAGVRNHEAVVWNPDQVRLRWLVELA